MRQLTLLIIMILAMASFSMADPPIIFIPGEMSPRDQDPRTGNDKFTKTHPKIGDMDTTPADDTGTDKDSYQTAPPNPPMGGPLRVH